MLSLTFILDTLKNDFSDNRIIKTQNYKDATITANTLTANGIEEIFPVGCYVRLDGTVFNNKVFKVSASGTNFITLDGLILDPKSEVCVKACLIPQEVIDFSLVEHKVPMLDSESIGAYSYSTSTPGVKGYVRKTLAPYYNPITFL